MRRLEVVAAVVAAIAGLGTWLLPGGVKSLSGQRHIMASPAPVEHLLQESLNKGRPRSDKGVKASGSEPGQAPPRNKDSGTGDKRSQKCRSVILGSQDQKT